jgi:transcriptional regulator with XRE-family HTH domain
MNNTNLAYDSSSFSYEELDNLKSNIIKKLMQLNTTLPELAKLIGIEYQTLRRITYREEKYIPNLRALYPIAEYFDVTISDLLKNPNVPQYVPLLSVSEVEGYLNESNNFDNYKTVFSDNFVHEKAFAINIETIQYGKQVRTTFILKPSNKLSVGNFILLKKTKEYYFLRVTQINNSEINAILIPSEKLIKFTSDEVYVIAMGIKQILNNNLL